MRGVQPVYSLFGQKFPLKKSALTHSVDTGLNRLAFEFAKRIGGDPMGRFRAFVGDTLRAIRSQAVELGIALADLPERPVHRFLDEIARIRGAFLDDRQLGRKDVIRRRFIMDRQHRNHGDCL